MRLNGDNSLLESSETSYNSWRYGPRWQAGGIKIIGGSQPSGNRIVRHTAKYNNGRGVWFDTVGSGNVVEASVFEDNVLIGLEFEASAGPNWIINNVIVGTIKIRRRQCRYDGAGIVLYEALRHPHLQQYNRRRRADPASSSRGAGSTTGCIPANTQVFNNIIVDSGTYRCSMSEVRDIVERRSQRGSHHFDNNLYYGNPTTIDFPKLGTLYGDEFWSLSEWQANRGEDLNSLDENPQFVKPSSLDFHC